MHSLLLNHHQELLPSTNDGNTDRIHFATELSVCLSVLSPNNWTQSASAHHHAHVSVDEQIGRSNHTVVECGDANDSLLEERFERQAVLRQCGQSDPIPFDQAYPDSLLKNCRKIGEGVYGEVFMCKVDKRAVVLKIIPIEGEQEVNGEPQKRFSEIISEIVITAKLSALRHGRHNSCAGFVELLQVRCVRGKYPDHLVQLWDLYAENKGTDNDNPVMFGDEQLYVVFELANAGEDLEAFGFENANQAVSALKQISLSLAVAEQELQFEHRDLHWGNILLSHCEETHQTFSLAGEPIVVKTHGVRATIIDYTLSRMTFGPHTMFNDLSEDYDLFTAGGDYQFEIYRQVRNRLKNIWNSYDPYTNVLWLHYLCDKMVNGASYLRKRSQRHQHAINQLMQLRDTLLNQSSAFDIAKMLTAGTGGQI